MLRLTALLVMCQAAGVLYAQDHSLRGRITDSTDNKKLEHAVVSILRKSDSTLVGFTRTDASGTFRFPAREAGEFVMLISYPQFADYMDAVTISGHTELGSVYLTPKSQLLDEVVIRTGSAIRIKGDTTEFMADSFKVKEGATVEDLLKKLPGFTVNSKGEIVAQGKRVDKVLVDDEEFFGDDPTMATQNISAKAVQKVQVFDTKTDQQNLTGLASGNEGKTVNIKLKEDAKKGSFGRYHLGTDFKNFLDAKAMYNRFMGKKKFSVYGTKTNINAGSLNWEDRQKLGFENDMEFDELSGFYYSFGGNDEFNDWSLRGLPDAYTAGGLYSDKWNADRQNVNISYRFNRLNTTNEGSTFTQNIRPTQLNFTNRFTKKEALNQQHAVNLKYEWKIDSLASIKLVSVNTLKTSHTVGEDLSEFFDGEKDTVNTSARQYDNYTDRKQTDNQLTYKQLFKKKNRIWQSVVRFGVTTDENSGLNETRIRYYQAGVFDHADTIDQMKSFDGRSTTMGMKSTFSEPLNDKWSLVLEYAYNDNNSISHRNTFEKDLDGKYETLINEFSNNFELDAYSHTGNAIMRYMGKKVRMAFGAGMSTVDLKLNNLDNNVISDFNFTNFTPQAQFNFTPKQQMNIGINYRGTTRQPTINQLQPLRDNTDPLNEYIGNPDLKVGFNHGVSLNFNQYKVLKQSYSFFYFSYNVTRNAITQNNSFDANGKRTYFPVNVNGNRNWFTGGNLEKQAGEKKPGYALNMNGNGGRLINFVDGQKVTTDYYTLGLGMRLAFMKTDKYNISFGPTAGYNSSISTSSKTQKSHYYTYGGRVDLDIDLPGKFEILSNLNADLREKLEAFSTNTNLVVWNASISKKIFKKDSGKISLVANDILNDNKGFSRTINNTAITDDRFQRVSRYFLLRFEWSFNKMPGGETK
jgi:hypothetical protein